MDPFSLFLLAAGTGLKAFGSWFKGSRAQAYGRLTNQIQQENAKILKLQAATAREGIKFAYARGAIAEGRTRQRIAAVQGAQGAHFAANFIDPLSGSPLLLQALTAAQGEADIEIIRADAHIEAAGARSRAASLEAEAGSALWKGAAAYQEGNDAYVAGIIGAGTALLTGGAQAWAGLNTGSTGSATAAWPAGGSNPVFYANNPWALR